MIFPQHNKVFRSRLLIAIVGVILMEVILLTHLFILQVQEQNAYQLMSEDNRLRYVSMTPTRGLLYDRNGFALARNRTLYHLELTPVLVEDMDTTLQSLKDIVALDDDDIERFKSRSADLKPFHSLRLKSKLSDEESARFAINRYRFKGVDIVGDLGRVYPYHEAFSHVIGYLANPDNQDFKTLNRSERHGIRYFGKYGLEQVYETQLRGKFGLRKVEVNAEGRVLRTVSEKKPIAGENITLTLDKNLQMAAYEALDNMEGAVVAMDPRNGDILAMVSRPTFDPNQFISGMSVAAYRKLLDSEHNVFFNRALAGQYPPGSTIKPMVALAGLKHQVTSPNYYMHAGPHYVVPGYERKFKDWRKEGHGWVNLRDSITQSCDVFFYDLSYRLGIDRISTFLQDFGFGQTTGIHIRHEAPGLVPSRHWKFSRYNQPWYPEETVITGIGQGYLLTTPLQLAVATATIANRGVRVHPRFVTDSVPGQDRDMRLGSGDPIAGKIDVAAEHWDYVISGMVDAVHRPNGTAYKIGYSAPYVIAGKTGTAQVYRLADDEEYKSENIDKKLRDHALFIAFAPVDKPTIAVAVIVEHIGSGSKYAAPIARRVMDTYFGVVETAGNPIIPQG